MDALFDGSSPEDHCYRNQHTYHNWSLVCHAWRIHAQSLLFRIVELTSPESLRKFSTLLGFAPHLAPYVRSLRVYSRHLFTPHNVLSVLPDEINAKLPNLRALAVTHISNVDSWHPLSSQPVSPAELQYVPLSQDFPSRLVPLSHVTTLKLYFVSCPCFCELARIVRAFHSLRILAIIEVHWRLFDPPPFMLKTVTDGKQDGLLPKIEDLTLSWLDEHGLEHILTALGSSSASSLKHLYVDCPPSPRADERPSQPLDVDLSHCTALHDLWISILHPLSACPDVADTFASLLASWRPSRAEGGRPRTPTLTITPTFESDFTREQFVDILRVLGPIAERTLLDRKDSPEVCICVIDCVEKQEWWAETVARQCFPRMYARGRVRAAFWKRYWDDCTWSDDREAGTEPVEGPPANAGAGTDTDTDTGMDIAISPAAADVLLAVPGLLTADLDMDVAAPAPVEDTPAGQPGGGDSYVPAPTPSAQTAHKSTSSVSGPPRGLRRSLKNLPAFALSKATKLVRALVGRSG